VNESEFLANRGKLYFGWVSMMLWVEHVPRNWLIVKDWLDGEW